MASLAIRLGLAAGVVCGAWVGAQDTTDFDAALAAYREAMERKSLAKHCDGWLLLGRTYDPRALVQLRRDYARPPEPVEFTRSSILQVAASHFAGAKNAEAWQSWREDHADRRAAWLWYHALRVEARAGRDVWAEVAAGDRPWTLRAAALAVGRETLRSGRPGPRELALVDAILDDLPRDPVAASVLRESALALFDTPSPDPLAADLRARLVRFVDAMADRRCPMRSRIVMSRLLARILARDDLGPDAEAWRGLVASAGEAADEIAYRQRRAKLRQTFFGIPDHSERIVFAIDASDSMLEPLTPDELDALRPITVADA